MRLEVTRRTDLAVRTLLVLADGERLKGAEIAQRVDSTSGFIPQVLNPLVRVGWVSSEPGPTGGYRLDVPLSSISMLEVVEAIEGPTDTGRCVLLNTVCSSERPCIMHQAWSRARSQLLAELDSIHLDELTDRPTRRRPTRR